MKTNEYMEQTEQYVLHTYNRFPLVIDHGEGVHLYDTDGKAYLVFHCFFIIVIAVAERIYRDTCRKVQICFSVGVIQMNALAVVDHEREPVIGVEHVLLGLFHILIRLHD